MIKNEHDVSDVRIYYIVLLLHFFSFFFPMHVLFLHSCEDKKRVCAVRQTPAKGLSAFKMNTFRRNYRYPRADLPFPQTAD